MNRQRYEELRDERRKAGLLDLDELVETGELIFGKRYCSNSFRDWITFGKRGIQLAADKSTGRILVRFADLMAFGEATGLIKTPTRTAIDENTWIPVLSPPACESPEDTAMLDRLAIARSRRERLATSNAPALSTAFNS